MVTAGERIADLSGHIQQVARLRSAAQRERRGIGLAENRQRRDLPLRRQRREVPADDRHAEALSGLRRAAAEGEHPLRAAAARRHAEQRPLRHAAHRGDVGEIPAHELPPGRLR